MFHIFSHIILSTLTGKYNRQPTVGITNYSIFVDLRGRTLKSNA